MKTQPAPIIIPQLLTVTPFLILILILIIAPAMAACEIHPTDPYDPQDHACGDPDSVPSGVLTPQMGLEADAGFSFEITATPSLVIIPPGGSTAIIIMLRHLDGAPQSVFVGCTQLFAGASTSFNPQYVMPSGSSIMTLQTLPSVPIGNYTIRIQASHGESARSTTVTIIIAPEPLIAELEISASPKMVTVRQGESTKHFIGLTQTIGAPRPVSLGLFGLPLGCSSSFDPQTINPGEESVLIVKTSPDADKGTYPLTILGECAGRVRGETVSLTITDPEPQAQNLGRWRGILSGFFRDEIPEVNASGHYLIPETRSSQFTIDLTLDMDQSDSGQVDITGTIRMALQEPARVIHLPDEKAAMSYSPDEFEGEIEGRILSPNQFEINWLDPPTTMTTLWSQYKEYEPSTHTYEEWVPGRVLDWLNPLTFAIQREGEEVALSSQHTIQWQIEESGYFEDYYATATISATGQMNKAWCELTDTDVGVSLTRNGGHVDLDLGHALLQAGDLITTTDGQARIRMPDYDLLLAPNTELEMVQTPYRPPANQEIATIATREAEEYPWKYRLSSPTYLAWVTEGNGNERPIPYGEGRDKGSAYIGNVLYKAGFPIPHHHLDGDPVDPITDDPARPDELFDTTRYLDILPVVKEQGAPVLYQDIQPGDLVIMPTQISVVTKVYPTSAEIIHYSPQLDGVEHQSGQIPSFAVIRRPTISIQDADQEGSPSLAFSLRQGMIRLFNATNQLAEAILAPIYSPEEGNLYTGFVELYTGLQELYTRVDSRMTEVFPGSKPLEFMTTSSKKYRPIMVTPVLAARGTDLIITANPDNTTHIQLLHGLAKIFIKDRDGVGGVSALFLYPGEYVIIGHDETLRGMGELDWQALDRWWEPEPLPTGLLLVDSTPRGASLCIDGEPQGSTPQQLDLAPGPCSVRIECPEYQAWWDVVNVAPLGTTTLDVALTPMQVLEMPLTFTVYAENGAHNLTILSASTTSSIVFDIRGESIHLLAPGPEGTTAQYRVTIPHQLLSGPYTVTANGALVESATTSTGSWSMVSFEHTHAYVAQNMVKIEGRYPVAEPTTTIAAILMIFFLATLVNPNIAKACKICDPGCGVRTDWQQGI